MVKILSVPQLKLRKKKPKDTDSDEKEEESESSDERSDSNKGDSNKAKKQEKKKKRRRKKKSDKNRMKRFRNMKKRDSSEEEEPDPFALPVENSLLKKKRFQYFQDRRERIERERVTKEDEDNRKADQEKRAYEVAQMEWEERRTWDVLELPERNFRRMKRDYDDLSAQKTAEAKRKFEEEEAMKEDGLTYRHRVVDKARKWKSSFALMTTYPGHNGHIYSLKLSKDGLHILTCSADETMKLWDVYTKECLLTMTGHVRAVRDCDVSPLFDLQRPDDRGENNLFISASHDKTLRVYLYPEKTSKHVLYGHKDSVLGVTFAPDGMRAVSCSADATLRMWDVVEGHCLFTYFFAKPDLYETATRKVKESVNCCRFSPSGRYIVAGSGYAERVVRLWYGGMPILYEPDEMAVRVKWHAGGLIRKIQLTQRPTKEFMHDEYDEYSPDEYVKSDESEEEKEKEEEEEDPYGMLTEEEKKKKRKPKEEDCVSCQIPDRGDKFGCSLSICNVDRSGKLEKITEYIPGVVFTVLLQSLEHSFDMFHMGCVKKMGEFSVYKPISGDRCGIFVQTSVPPGVKLSLGRQIACSIDRQKKQEIRIRWRAPPIKTGPVVFKVNLSIPRVDKPPLPVMLRLTLKEGEPVYGNILDRQRRKRKMIKPKVDIQMRHVLFQEYVEAKDLKSAAMMVDDACKLEDISGQKLQGKDDFLELLSKRIPTGSIFKKVNKIGLIETSNKVIRELRPPPEKGHRELDLSKSVASASVSLVSAITEPDAISDKGPNKNLAENAPTKNSADGPLSEGAASGKSPSLSSPKSNILSIASFGKGKSAKSDTKKEDDDSDSDEKSLGLVDKLLPSAFDPQDYMKAAKKEIKKVMKLRKAGLECSEEVRSIFVPSGFTMPTTHFSKFHQLPQTVSKMIEDAEEGNNAQALQFEILKDGLFGAHDQPHLRMPLPDTYPIKTTHPVTFARPALEKAAILENLNAKRQRAKEIHDAKVAPKKPVDVIVEEMVEEIMKKNRTVLLETLERRDAYPEVPALGDAVKFKDESFLKGQSSLASSMKTAKSTGRLMSMKIKSRESQDIALTARTRDTNLSTAHGKGTIFSLKKNRPRAGRRGGVGVLPGFETGHPNRRGYVDKDAETAEQKGGLVRTFNEGYFCHADSIQCAVFSMDESRVASGSSDGIIKLWDPGLGKFIRSLEQHRFSVQGLCFSSDGVFLASCSVDMSIILWEVERGMAVQTLRGHSDIVHTIFFAQKDNFLFSCSSDGTMKSWCVTPSVPLPPERPDVRAVSRTQILVSWKPAPAFNTPFTAFRISWRRGIRGKFRYEISVNGKDLQRKINNLDTGCAYQFRVCGVNRMGQGEWSEPSPKVVTHLDVPEAPDRPEVIEATQHSLKFLWFMKRSTIPEAKLKHYTIQLSGEGHDFGQGGEQVIPYKKCREDAEAYVKRMTEKRRIGKSQRQKYKRTGWVLMLAEWQGLRAGRSYRFRMCATNQLGDGPYSKPSITYPTLPKEPNKGIPPKVKEVTTTTMVVSWKPPEENGSPISEYLLRMCEDGFRPIKLSKLCLDYTFENLLPGTEYSFQIKAANHVGYGEYSEPSAPFSTATAAPFAPEHPLVGRLKPVEVLLHVKQPRDNGKPIRHYKVQRREYVFGKRVWGYDQISKTDPAEDTVKLRFTGLIPDSFFSFRVCAMNMHGPSEYSQPSRWIRTPPAKVPKTPRDLEVTNIEGSNNGISSCTIKWKPAEDGGAPILEYLVEFCSKTTRLQPDPREWDRELVDDMDADDVVSTECHVEGLPGGVLYKFKVSAKNIVGWGKASKPLVIEGSESDDDDDDGDDD